MFELINSCRVCGSDQLDEVLHLGEQPLANDLRLPSDEKPGLVPLVLVRCGICTTVQLTATVDPAVLFSDYVWVTGTGSATREFSEVFCSEVLKRWESRRHRDFDSSRMVLEVASNDGTFLRCFQERGWEVLGVDPAGNIAARANSTGIPTRCDFFNSEVAREISCQSPADVVVARNVIPHVEAIHEVVEGISSVMRNDGVAAIEFHYAGSILSGLQYDSIYHEHLFYFSLTTLSSLCAQHGLVAFDVFDSPISGGALVLLLSATDRGPSVTLRDRLVDESAAGVNDLETWTRFASDCRAHSASLTALMRERSARGRVLGYGASARSSTMLNFAGIDSNQIHAVVDRNEMKHGRLMPGSAIPVVSPAEGRELLVDSDAVVLLAWNFASEVVEQLRDEGYEGNIILPLPNEPRLV